MFFVAMGRCQNIFSVMSLSKWSPGSHIGFFVFRTLILVWLWILSLNFTGTSLVCMERSLLIFIYKMAAWQPYCFFWYLDSVGGIVASNDTVNTSQYYLQSSLGHWYTNVLWWYWLNPRWNFICHLWEECVNFYSSVHLCYCQDLNGAGSFDWLAAH